jgi:hypothetical protein
MTRGNRSVAERVRALLETRGYAAVTARVNTGAWASWLRFGLLTLFCLLAVGAVSERGGQDNAEQVAAEAEILKLGGYVRRLGLDPKQPVVAVFLRGPQFHDTNLVKYETLLSKASFLSVDCPDVSDRGLCSLRTAAQLQFLSISSPRVDGSGLANLRRSVGLISLQLRCPRLTDAGLEHLKTAGQLTHLFVECARMTDVGLVQLKHLRELEYLSLRGSRITDAGLLTVGDYDKLRRLHIPNAAVSDAGLIHLSGLKNLTDLEVGGTAITDKGLESLTGLSRLARLDLIQTSVTDAGVRKLKTALPLLEVNLRARDVDVTPAAPLRAPLGTDVGEKAPDRAERWSASWNAGYAALQAGSYGESERRFREALHALPTFEDGDRRLADSYEGLGWALAMRGRYSEA